MKKLLGVLAFLTLSQSIFAYSILTTKKVDWDKVTSVDVFIAGYGKELGLQFLQSAVTRAERHDELYPDTRAQLIIWAKEWSKRKDAKAITSRGFNLIKSKSGGLTHKNIFNQLKRLPKIASLHIFSHNAAFSGNAIQRTMRLGHQKFPWKALVDNFAEDSYVFLHGCNTGYIVAPGISKIIKRPVMGSLSSTDFQEIFADGIFYHNNSHLRQYPAGMARLKTSSILFEREFSCWKGYCHRMTPNNHPYRGYWGRYKVGLPYYQAFCTFPDNQGAKCGKAVAEAINGNPSIGAQTWEDRVIDYICPRMEDPSVRATCEAVLKGTSTEAFFDGKIAKCGRDYCSVDIKNGVGNTGKKVQIFDGPDAGNAQILKDYNYFLGLEKYLK